MSSWLNEQQANAFELYSKYLALNLHFKEGSSFDYSMYMGNTKITFEGFLAKPMAFKRKFIELFNKVQKYDFEDFLFANIKVGVTTAEGLLGSKSIQNYNNWYGQYGNGNNYEATVKRILSEYIADHKKPTVTQLFIEIFENENEEFDEVLIWGMIKNPGLDGVLRECAKGNILQELNFKRIERLKKIYLYFNIL